MMGNQSLDYVRVQLIKEKPCKQYDYTINDSQSAIQIFQDHIAHADREMFYVLALNAKNVPNAFSQIHVGSLSETYMHAREIFKVAMLSNSQSIILGHNHPSGDLTPSQSDLNNTKRIVQIGHLMDIEVLDHIIVGPQGGKSMRSDDPNIFNDIEAVSNLWKR